MRSPKWSGNYLNFQCNVIIAVTPGGSILPSGTETSRLHSIVTRTEIKYVASTSLGYCNSEWVPPPFPWLDSWTCEPWIWKKWQCMVDSESECTQHSGEHGPSPARHLASTLSLQKAIPAFLASQLLHSSGNMQNSLNSMKTGPLLHFFCCEVRSPIRSNSVCNTRTVDTALLIHEW